MYCACVITLRCIEPPATDQQRAATSIMDCLAKEQPRGMEFRREGKCKGGGGIANTHRYSEHSIDSFSEYTESSPDIAIYKPTCRDSTNQ
jgi:hypothetical protein